MHFMPSLFPVVMPVSHMKIGSSILQFMRRHPRLVYTVYLVAFVMIGLEVGLRFYMDFQPGYYVGFTNESDKVRQYAYGEMRYNSAGYPDDEFFEQKVKPRIGYAGDSVCQGVGCGYGYRISEVLEKQFPQFEHMNIARGMNTALHRGDADFYVRIAKDFELDAMILLFNLNDIMPDAPERKKEAKKTFRVRRLFDGLRGKSYLYTYLRNLAKSAAMRSGYREGDMKMYELFPGEMDDVFKATAGRINRLSDALSDAGVELYVVILPYEMQVSSEAERVYRDKHGIQWGGGFIPRGSQEKMLEHLDFKTVLDAYYAFIGPDGNPSRDAYGIGEYFVYNKGDRLDWNHPNREGHRLVAEYMARELPLFAEAP